MQKRKNDRNGRRLRAQGGAPRPPPPEEPRQSLNKDNCHWGAGLRHCWMLLLGPDKQGHRGGHTCGGMGSSPDAVEKAKGGSPSIRVVPYMVGALSWPVRWPDSLGAGPGAGREALKALGLVPRLLSAQAWLRVWNHFLPSPRHQGASPPTPSSCPGGLGVGDSLTQALPESEVASGHNPSSGPGARCPP